MSRVPDLMNGTLARRIVRLLYTGLVLVTISAGAWAASEPQQLVAQVIDQVLTKLSGLNPAIAPTDPVLLTLFEQELSPHLDFATITHWLVGADWANYSEADQAAVIAAVHEHVVQVYAALLVMGRDVVIEIEPNATVLARSAKVGAHLAAADGRTLDVEFRLIRSADSWKLYDLVVAGVSFARSLKSELSPVIDAGGVEGLKTYLVQHRR